MERLKIKSILVPFDFSACATAALKAAKDVGRKFSSQLELVFVKDLVPAFLSQNVDTLEEDAALAAYEGGFSRRLREAAGDYPEAWVHVLEGSPAAIFKRLAADAAADLVVMGTRGRGELRQLFSRSTTEAVVRVSRSPVLTVHEGSGSFRPSRILVPVNFTTHARRALGLALILSQAFRAKVTALHVAQDWSRLGGVEDFFREHLRLLSEAEGVEAAPLLKVGLPEEAILEEAASGRHDLVVLSAHRRRVWKEWMLGTTAERVLRHSPIPVLSLPSQGVATQPRRALAEPGQAALAERERLEAVIRGAAF